MVLLTVRGGEYSPTLTHDAASDYTVLGHAAATWTAHWSCPTFICVQFSSLAGLRPSAARGTIRSHSVSGGAPGTLIGEFYASSWREAVKSGYAVVELVHVVFAVNAGTVRRVG